MIRKILKTMVLAAVAGVLIFLYQNDIRDWFGRLEREKVILPNPLVQLEGGYPGLENLFGRSGNTYSPCERPIVYAIGSFDARFGISQSDFARAIREAKQIWEKPIGKELFANSPDGDLKINLIYDARQDATVKLRKYGLDIRDSKESYDALKATYELFTDEYARDKAQFESQITVIRNREDAYNEEVAAWNKRGGAPQEEYDRLNAEKASIDQAIAKINQMKDDLNTKTDRVNAVVMVLNRLAAALNIEVARYNEIGGAHAGEFEEGVYRSNQNGREIDIYQFDDRAKLVRVLAHELGHALGLDHLANPKAIMYRLNQGANEKLTSDDLAALKNRCKIE